ncbi:MAG: hypothetical protein KatS3mg009_2411 [Acidimicrobiia bacterium]|nr:MAG: hypothetical protein KatS3mg009_2411 [Acidimicrobiia bacterium]
MRVVYLGTPDDAVGPLRALVAAGHEVALVVTQPDRRRSRGGRADPSPVRRAAEELGLPVRVPARAREVVGDVRASGADAGVVVAFGQLLPVALLEAVPLGFVNVHFSLLPRWRGAAPVERAILAGDDETGVCLMRVEEGLDTGPGVRVRAHADRARRDRRRAARPARHDGDRAAARAPAAARRPRGPSRSGASRPTPGSSRWTSSASTRPVPHATSRAWCGRATRGPARGSRPPAGA